MPQMAPYNWLQLNFMFSLIFIALCCLIYFNFSPPQKEDTLIPIKKKNLSYFIKW